MVTNKDRSNIFKRADVLLKEELNSPFGTPSWSNCLKQAWAEFKATKPQKVKPIKEKPLAVLVPVRFSTTGATWEGSVWVPRSALLPEMYVDMAFWKRKIQQARKERAMYASELTMVAI